MKFHWRSILDIASRGNAKAGRRAPLRLPVSMNVDAGIEIVTMLRFHSRYFA